MTTAPHSEPGRSANAIQRRARIGDKLITKGPATSGCSGFGLVSEPDARVYLSPGTELAFDKDIHYYDRFRARRFYSEHKTAKFRHLPDDANANNEALELSDGRLVMIAELAGAQRATVMHGPHTSPS